MITSEDKNFVPVGRTLLIKILIASGIVTTLVTIVSFYLDYTAELNTLENTFSQIKKSSAHAITQASWFENDQVLESQLNGILKINDIVEVYIINEDDKKIYNYKKELSSLYLDSRQFDLIHGSDDSDNHLGYLIVIASKDDMYARLIKKVIYVFLSQLFKTLIVSFVLLGIFKQEVTIHIRNIMDYLQRKDLTNLHIGGDLTSPYSRVRTNEFDKLNDSINIMTTLVAENNIEKEKQMEEKDTELERQKSNAINTAKLAALGEMASGIAHEINNPLTVIALAAKSMEKKLKTKKDINTKDIMSAFEDDHQMHMKYLELIHEHSFRIQRIIESMKRQARDGENDPFELITVDVLLSDVLDLSDAKFKQAGIQLGVLADMNTVFACRRIQLSQVLINLFNNSYDAVLDTKLPWVELEIKEVGHNVVIVFTDSGDGIPFDIQDKILQPFFTTKEIGKGTGLGLSISSNIIENHGGSFLFDSECSNTRFIITIPREQFQQQVS